MNEEKMPIAPIEILKGRPLVMGKEFTPLKVIIYGPNGVGKSTFASHFKSPLWIDLEQKSQHLDVPKLRLETFEEFKECVKWLTEKEHSFSTVVIDSLDQLEAIVQNYIEKLYPPNQLGFGGLHKYVVEQFDNDILKTLQFLFEKKKMNIVLIGHEAIVHSNDARHPMFDRYELKINQKLSYSLKNWVLCIFFATYEINFEKKENIGFTQTRLHALSNDRRVLHTTGTPTYLASNIYNLPHSLKLTKTPETYNALVEAIKNFFVNQKEEGEK